MYGTAAAAAGLIYSKQSEASPLKTEHFLIAAPQEDGEIKIGDKTYQVRSVWHTTCPAHRTALASPVHTPRSRSPPR